MGKKKDKKKKHKKDKKKKKKVVQRKRVVRRPPSPYQIVAVKNDKPELMPQRVTMDNDTYFEISIYGQIYRVQVDKKHNCLRFRGMNGHCIVQPLSVSEFLIRSKSFKEEEKQ